MTLPIQNDLISVLITSMGRPTLIRTLKSIEAARVPSGLRLEVVIADDRPERAVSLLLADFITSLAIRVVDVGAHNVSRARNATLKAARGEWLALVDDDEWVEPNWLEGLYSTAQEFAADAVFGPVQHHYPEGTPDWFVAANPMFLDLAWHETGRTTASGSSGNAMVRHSTLDRLGLRFAEAFGRSSGEDDDLFRRLSASGARLVVTDRAWVHEDVPEARANATYMAIRAKRGGQTYAKVTLRQTGPVGHLAFAVDSAAKLAVGALGAAAARPFNRSLSFRLHMKVWVNQGKLLAMTNAPLLSSWA